MSGKFKQSQHPGSSREEIENEPDWFSRHTHRVGFYNHEHRLPGLTNDSDSHTGYSNEDFEEAIRNHQILKRREANKDLVNFQDVMKSQPGLFPAGWRFVVDTTEDFIKSEEDWPANIKARQKKEEAEAKAKEKDNQEPIDDEEQWRRENADQSNKHSDAYAVSEESHSTEDTEQSKSDNSTNEKSEYETLREKYTPQEIALLRCLQHERDYITKLGENDGTSLSPVAKLSRDEVVAIDTADAGTPDNWIPRSGDLMRLTGQHPMNGEPKLTRLFNAGLITPNWLHYTRNHGSVPRLFWKTHKVDIEHGALTLSMDELKAKFEAVNIAVALACDGNRRGELNLIKKSKGFSWGPGAVSCAYWKGAKLADVLSLAGVTKSKPGQRRWVNFEGSDVLSEGSYSTCIPLEHALDPANDVLLAYEMNDNPLPPDHGYPVRVLIPGWVGGRSVKWVKRIWTSDIENDSHYHIWDNRVLPSFITEKDGNFADTMFNHPSTLCNEQNLNSIIVYPEEGEVLSLGQAELQKTYRISGIAYDGSGHEVQRVEISLDEGETWLYCFRTFPDQPIRHGNKYWTWVHWHIDVDVAFLFRAKSIAVRCFNVFKNTQPKYGSWNTMGMMNNGWYALKAELTDHKSLVWHHPFDPVENNGWMRSSIENQLAAAKNDSGVPDKQFTRQEVEKHCRKEDCWIVINNNVYDATAVLKWHPGGASSILAYAGRLTAETTSSFESVHDDYAHKKLQECVLGRLTKKAGKFIKESEKKIAKEIAKQDQEGDMYMRKDRWLPVTLKQREKVSDDTYVYTFELPNGKTKLGIETCQHIQFGIHMADKMVVRSYTPTSPVLEPDKHGRFKLTIKTYYPNDDQPGGAFSNLLLYLPIGERVEIKGPTGEIVYNGEGKFTIEGRKLTFNKVNLVLGGSGVTPGYQLLAHICNVAKDKTQVRIIDANKSEGDILLKEELREFEDEHGGQIHITHILSHPGDSWNGQTGHIDAALIQKVCFPPEENTATFLCGPPAMIQKAALPALTDWGFKEEENMWGF